MFLKEVKMTEKDKTAEETFLKRWSRRKNLDDVDQESITSLELEPALDESAQNEKNEIDNEIISAENEAEEKEMIKNREAAEAIDLEALSYDSDFQPFMKKGVPQLLKNIAMRKLWTSNPLLANVDGLNDYDENFADPALNYFKSNWKVGRGFLTDEDDEIERVRQLALREEAEAREVEKSTSGSDETTADEALNDETVANDALEDDEPTQVSSDEVSDNDTITHQSHEVDHKATATSKVSVASEALSEENSSVSLVSPQTETEENFPTVKRVSLRKRLLEN